MYCVGFGVCFFNAALITELSSGFVDHLDAMFSLYALYVAIIQFISLKVYSVLHIYNVKIILCLV